MMLQYLSVFQILYTTYMGHTFQYEQCQPLSTHYCSVTIIGNFISAVTPRRTPNHA